ncbi:MAG: hypothetical protein HYS05_22270 [Acidobacteria bacterium]|nr:hypothetical protein [Acidobacteriota bacterium]
MSRVIGLLLGGLLSWEFLTPLPPVGSPQSGAGRGFLTIETLLDIKHPSRATWAPGGDRLAFVWDRGGVQNIYVARLVSASDAPQPVTSFDTGLIDMLAWTPAGTLVFARDGRLWQVSPERGLEPRVVPAGSTIVASCSSASASTSSPARSWSAA